MKELSKKLTGQKIRDEMLKRNMTVRDLQETLELDSPQSIYKWLRGESLPSLSNMLLLGELFRVPLETLLIREDGSPAYHRIFDSGFPCQIGLLFQENDDFSFMRRQKARTDRLAKNCFSKTVTLSSGHLHPKASHS